LHPEAKQGSLQSKKLAANARNQHEESRDNSTGDASLIGMECLKTIRGYGDPSLRFGISESVSL
jgi:hypothetical protein